MAMTAMERACKEDLLDILYKQNFGDTYLPLLEKFEINLTNDPGVVAYIDIHKGVIVINSQLDIEQVSVVVRHEIMHYKLQHEKRLLAKLARDLKGVELEQLEDLTIKELQNILYGDPEATFNYAGDYEISNFAYEDILKDKDTVRNLTLNGIVVGGLVTEDDHPDWINLTIEELYDELQKQRKKDIEAIKNSPKVCNGAFIDDSTFVGVDGRTYGI